MFYDFITKYTEIFCRKNERSFCTAKASHIFSTKYIGKYQILTFEILTNDVVSFEQPGPGLYFCYLPEAKDCKLESLEKLKLKLNKEFEILK